MDKLCLLLDFADISFREAVEFTSRVENFEEVLKLSDKELTIALGGNVKRGKKLAERRSELDSFLKEMKENEIEYVSFYNKGYPNKLKRVDNPPLVLYYKGDLSIAENFGIGVIGSRKPTVYGSYVAKTLTEKLVEAGVTIISGMAEGIDGIAHKTAVDAKGETIAVMGSGFNKIYPSTNIKLYNRILENKGLVITENHHKKTVLPYMFMMRNRMISSLGEGLLIVEAGLKSGTMTTVDFGLEQGKTIFAVPGNINSPLSVGTNSLIKNGAVMVNSASDILNEFPKVSFLKNNSPDNLKSLSSTEIKVVETLAKRGNLHIEVLANMLNINIKDLSGVLNILEIKGIVSELGNKLYTYIE